ncbi:MAG: phospho-N-acetylmuramoyl-pentapeptide-transferase [Clostridiales bacterium]|nr:phospho-N-acetylmuramoyl-pentapeptide-transferase [Clostridiales bacterium]
MTVDILLSFAISFVITVVLGFVLIPVLRNLKAGQSIKRDGPIWHLSKEGTPTMGGLMFIIAMLAVTLVFSLRYKDDGGAVLLSMFVFSLVFGVIGFIDDFEKIRHKGNQGLTALQKFLLQLVAAVAFVLLLRYLGYLTPNLYIPFVNVTIPLPEVVYLVFAAFVIVGTVNSVNLTDGVDGLVSGVSIPVALFFVAAAWMWGMEVQGIFAASLLGGLAGFLVFNFNPAKVFMGDTGSLFLGGAVCAMAFALDMPLILIPLGIVYIAETLSDIIQVAYFKATHGKRFFKMAPLHHHFEKSGWSEKKVFAVFTAVSLVFAVISMLGVMSRYGF